MTKMPCGFHQKNITNFSFFRKILWKTAVSEKNQELPEMNDEAFLAETQIKWGYQTVL